MPIDNRSGIDPYCTLNATFAALRNAEIGPRAKAKNRFHQKIWTAPRSGRAGQRPVGPIFSQLGYFARKPSAGLILANKTKKEAYFQTQAFAQ